MSFQVFNVWWKVHQVYRSLCRQFCKSNANYIGLITLVTHTCHAIHFKYLVQYWYTVNMIYACKYWRHITQVNFMIKCLWHKPALCAVFVPFWIHYKLMFDMLWSECDRWSNIYKRWMNTHYTVQFLCLSFSLKSSLFHLKQL